MKLHKDYFSKKFEAVLIAPNLSNDEFIQSVNEFFAYKHFISHLTINPTQIELACQITAGTGLQIASVAGYPLGNLPMVVKAVQIETALEMGAEKIEIVLPIEYLLDNEKEKAQAEVEQLMRLFTKPTSQAVWIANLALLPTEKKIEAGQIINSLGLNLMTNTGINTITTSEDIRLLRKEFPQLNITACGGGEIAENAQSFFEAGADCVATHEPAETFWGLQTILEQVEK